MNLASTVTTFFTDNWLSVLIAVIVGIFGGGGIAALLKARPEGSKILVDAAQGAVVIQSSVLESLQAHIVRQDAEIAELRTHISEVNTLRANERDLRERVRELEHQNELLIAENTAQAAQIAELTRRLDKNGFDN